MEIHIRGLEALGKKQDTYGDLLIPIVLGKLPTTIKYNLIRENGSTKWSVEQLRKSILKEIQILEAGEETDSFSQIRQTCQHPTINIDSTDKRIRKVWKPCQRKIILHT
jgi:hypothetical protein